MSTNGNTWPEQEWVYEWAKRHGIERNVPAFLELSTKLSEPRMAVVTKKQAQVALHRRLTIRCQKRSNDRSRDRADFHFRRWDEVEDALVMNYDLTVSELVRRLGRTRYAIKTRRKKLRKLNSITT